MPRFIDSIKKAQDRFFDKPIYQEELSDFDRAFRKAQNSTSVAGELCKLAGGFGLFLGLIFTAYAFATGYIGGGLFGIGSSFALAVAGAPLMAIGTIANNSKKQTALLALQTWNSVPID